MSLRVEIVTVFPDYFGPVIGTGVLGRARDAGLVAVSTRDPRDFTTDRHRTVDDHPYGGGSGMVMKPEPLVAAIEAAREAVGDGARVLLLTPQGRRFDQGLAGELMRHGRLVLVCGRYEGIDERVRAFVDAEVSIGDFVLSGGEPAAAVMLDAIARLVPGVLGNVDSLREESFAADAQGQLEYPQYTRPREFRGMSVPEVLMSGDHAAIDRWRCAQRRARTEVRRPDLAQPTFTNFNDSAR
jgi:tRNA (guanine37-N1)-methyltransferase